MSREEIKILYHYAVSELSNKNSQLLQAGRTRMLCPFCKGGTSKDLNTLQLFIIAGTGNAKSTKDFSNGVFFKCYRASCAKTGFIALDESIQDIVLPSLSDAKIYHNKGIYTKALKTIPPKMIADAQALYPALEYNVMRACGVKLTEENECTVETLHIPLHPYKSAMTTGGYHLRSLWPGYDKRVEWDPGFSLNAHRGSWFSSRLEEEKLFKDSYHRVYGNKAPISPVIVVEDALSALVTARWMPTYALLGATLSSQAAASTFAQVNLILLWVDPDLWEVRPGTRHAPIVDLVARLSSYCPVVPRKLQSDPKYLDKDEILTYINEDITGAINTDPVYENRLV